MSTKISRTQYPKHFKEKKNKEIFPGLFYESDIILMAEHCANKTGSKRKTIGQS